MARSGPYRARCHAPYHVLQGRALSIVQVAICFTVALKSSSATLLIAHHDHDLARAVSIAGIVVAAMVGLAVALYRLIDQRMTRVESATARDIAINRDILAVLRQQNGSRTLN